MHKALVRLCMAAVWADMCGMAIGQGVCSGICVKFYDRLRNHTYANNS